MSRFTVSVNSNRWVPREQRQSIRDGLTDYSKATSKLLTWIEDISWLLSWDGALHTAGSAAAGDSCQLAVLPCAASPEPGASGTSPVGSTSSATQTEELLAGVSPQFELQPTTQPSYLLAVFILHRCLSLTNVQIDFVPNPFCRTQ